VSEDVRLIEQPSDDLIQALEATQPRNPFCTVAYARARRLLGDRVLLASVFDRSHVVAGALGFVAGGAGRRRLEIPSVAYGSSAADFCFAVARWGRRNGVWEVDLGSFGSEAADVPSTGGELARTRRREFVLDLTSPNPLGGISTNHRRNITKARNAGVEVRRSRHAPDSASHRDLVTMSLERRRDRGEGVEDEAREDLFAALLETGAGELFQAWRGSEILSSVLVLRSVSGAYYHSAGTTDGGTAIGASQLLVAEIALALKNDGAATFNLGGADAASAGLQRFKASFGATVRELDAVNFCPMPAAARKLRTLARVLLRNPAALPRAVLTADRFVVYAANPAAVPHPPAASDLVVRRLTDEELERFGADGSEWADQARRVRVLGFNQAYGVFRGDDLVHIAWLIEVEQDRSLPVRNVRLRSGEGEITHCYTAASARGHGVYPLAIAALCRIAAARGMRLVFMMTNRTNLASRRGIEKAGFAPAGRIWAVRLPWMRERPLLTIRGHRW
jgi:hypothetical protein